MRSQRPGPPAGSGNPRAAAHQGSPGQFIGLAPGLDPRRPQHQEPHRLARLARVPARLRHVPAGQAGRNLVQAVECSSSASIVTTSRVGPRPSRTSPWLVMFRAVTEPASVASTTRWSIQASDNGTR